MREFAMTKEHLAEIAASIGRVLREEFGEDRKRLEALERDIEELKRDRKSWPRKAS